MRHRCKLAVILVFTAFLWLVGLQVVWPFLPDCYALGGVAKSPPAALWSASEVASGRTFRALEASFGAELGLRNFWVRLDNQMSLSVFGEVTVRSRGTRIVGGRDGWLFELPYVQAAVTPGAISEERTRETVARIRSVQDKLARRGLPFLLIVAPSKAEIYPERVPKDYLAGRKPSEVTTDFERARPLLEAAEINILDAARLFSEWKHEGRKDLFAASGTHWSYDATFSLLPELRSRLNPSLRHPIPEPLPARFVEEPARRHDADLHWLANLLWEDSHRPVVRRPVLSPQTLVPQKDLPRLLWVNDSFGFTLFEQVYAAGLARPSQALYYFANCYDIPGSTKTGMDLKTVEWETFLTSYDAVIVVLVERAWEKEAWGFFRSVDEQLK